MKRKKLIVAVWMIVLSSFFSLNTYAAPAGVDTSKVDVLTDIVLWIARIAIAAAGGIPACQKIVQGKADENPKEMNAGISTLIVTGAVFGATFALKAVLF